MRLRSKQDIRAEIDRAFGAWEAEFGYSIREAVMRNPPRKGLASLGPCRFRSHG